MSDSAILHSFRIREEVEGASVSTIGSSAKGLTRGPSWNVMEPILLADLYGKTPQSFLEAE